MNVVFADVTGKTDGFAILVDANPISIGRGVNASVVVADRWASRIHCHLAVEGRHLVVTDVDSRHGTFVNGIRVAEAILSPGDELQVGLHLWRVEYECYDGQITSIGETDDSRQSVAV